MREEQRRAQGRWEEKRQTREIGREQEKKKGSTGGREGGIEKQELRNDMRGRERHKRQKRRDGVPFIV